MVSEELSKFLSVGRVFVDTEFEVFAELFVELEVVFVVLGDFTDEFDGFLDEVFADDLEDLVVLKELSGDVEGKVIGVDDTLDEVEPFGDEFFAIVHDENSSDVELDVVALLLSFEHVEGSSLGDEED